MSTTTTAAKQTRTKPQPKSKGRKNKNRSIVQLTDLLDQKSLLDKAGAFMWDQIHTAIVQKVEADFCEVALDKPSDGGQLTAKIPKQELVETPSVGDRLEVYLEEDGSLDKEKPSAIASVRKAREINELNLLGEAIESKSPVRGFVASPIKGGYSVSLFVNSREEAEKGLGFRAFLPKSQANFRNQQEEFSDEAPFWFKVKEFEPKSGNIIVSLKEILLKQKRVKEKQFWASAEVGQVCKAVVQSIVSYGAFVDVGGVDALLHVSDMSWSKQAVPREIVRVGQTLDVKVLLLDKKNKKIKVGLKQLVPDPWETIKSQFKPGMDVEGKIVALFDFGAFVELADGVEGMVHTSEISWQRIKHPSTKFKIGDDITARVLSVDEKEHRISLSTKLLEQNPVEKLSEKFPAGAVLKTHITSVQSYGVFVELSNTVTGLVHIGELSWTKRVEHPSEMFSEGQEVEIVVLGFDIARQRVSCSIKRTSEDPWADWRKKFAKGTRHQVEVTKVQNQGAECELAPGLIGFCPARELTSEKVNRAQEAVKVGQKLEVEVKQCDVREQKILLSVKLRKEKETREDYQVYLAKQSEESSTNVSLKEALKNVDVKGE